MTSSNDEIMWCPVTGNDCNCQGRGGECYLHNRGKYCRTGCATQFHPSWGDCARTAHIAIDRTALAKGRT